MMKRFFAVIVTSAALSRSFAGCAAAADLAFFLGRSCDELIRDMAAANKAAAFANDAVTHARDRASREKGLATASAVLVGLGWWSAVDRSNTDNILAEIRAEKTLIARAAQQKQCAA